MQYRMAVWVHVLVEAAIERLSDRRGQGTVEYVGVVVMVTLLVAAVAAAASGWGDAIGGQMEKALKDSIKRATQGLSA